MKEQLRQEIERIWKDKMTGHGTTTGVDRIGKLAAILRDLEAADASAVFAARYTGSNAPMYRTGPMGRL